MTTIEPSQLPSTVRSYLSAHAAGEVDRALRAFAPSAVVVDEGHTFRGTEEVRAFLDTAGSAYTYTTELIGAERTGETHWVAINRLQGDFPGGVVVLRYRLALSDGLITELVIAP